MDTISFMIPNRNREKRYLDSCLYSLSIQEDPVEEIVVADMSTMEPYISETEDICDEYGAKLIHTSIPPEDINYEDYLTERENYNSGKTTPWTKTVPMPQKWITKIPEEDFYERYVDLFLHTTNYNIGIKNCTKDIICWMGQDTLASNNTTKVVKAIYNYPWRKPVVIRGKCWYLPERCKPTHDDIKEWHPLELSDGRKWRGGLAFIAGTREWFHKIRGFDQTIRWYNDNHLIKRARLDGKIFIWCGRKTSSIPKVHVKECSFLHLSHDRKKPKHFGRKKDPSVVALARRGKFLLSGSVKSPIICNDDNWGEYNKSVGFWHQIWKKHHFHYSPEEAKWIKKRKIKTKRKKKMNNLNIFSRRNQFLGGSIMHRPSETYYLEQILFHNRFKKIVEFGTWQGALSILFGLYALRWNGKAITFDIKEEPKSKVWCKVKPVLPLEFYQLDVFTPKAQVLVDKFIKKKKALIYCDGGIKKDEFNMYAYLLKPGDFIMAHDRGREIQLKDIAETVEKCNLEPMYEKYITPLKLRQFCFRRREDE